jgi:charged multivesicular body protein 5
VSEKQPGDLAQQSSDMKHPVTILSLKDTKTTVNATKLGVREMKKLHLYVNMNQTEDLQDQPEDLMEGTNTIQEAQSVSLAPQNQVKVT